MTRREDITDRLGEIEQPALVIHGEDEETKQAVEESGGTWTPHPAESVIDRMVDEFGRTGRSGGGGFYDYGDDGRRTSLWPGLREHLIRNAYQAE